PVDRGEVIRREHLSSSDDHYITATAQRTHHHGGRVLAATTIERLIQPAISAVVELMRLSFVTACVRILREGTGGIELGRHVRRRSDPYARYRERVVELGGIRCCPKPNTVRLARARTAEPRRGAS